jgi:hypothetical protein
MVRKFASTVAAAVLMSAVIAFGVGAAPASASPPADSAVTSADSWILLEAPTCVSRAAYEVPDGFHVFMTNNCGVVRYVRVIIDWAPDSVCIQLLVGQSRTFQYRGVTGQYDHLAVCNP